ncbi:MAG: ABC transporter ATP-binding protein [Syntrophomonadaceae bacterium]|nr:ABC transporter ATP-binding protein [Syntrophomonadaceae bacterium]
MKLEVENGEYNYPKGKTLFQRVNFYIDKGEILTILGPNGVGKTTLLKCTTSLLKWTMGNTFIDGWSIDELGQKTIWKSIGYVPQGNGSVFSYTVLDMVLMGRAPRLGLFSLPSRKDIEFARHSLEMVGISHLENKACSEISGGELQLVLIARALTSQPQILILDEPESHLDFKNQLIILDILMKVAKQEGISCIINTHYPDHALHISDKTLMLGKNKEAIFGKSEKIITEENLKEYFDVDVRIIPFDYGGKKLKTIVPVAI